MRLRVLENDGDFAKPESQLPGCKFHFNLEGVAGKMNFSKLILSSTSRVYQTNLRWGLSDAHPGNHGCVYNSLEAESVPGAS